MTFDGYDASALYVHLLIGPSWQRLRAPLRYELAAVDPGAGTVVELGAGSGIGTELLLDTVPAAPVLALEPSIALRAVLLGRMAGHRFEHRLTVLPDPAEAAELPDRICAVLGANMIGHLDPDARSRLWCELAARLTPGAPVLVNADDPDLTDGKAVPTTEVRVAGLTYAGTGRAEPDGADAMRWSMRYTTHRGETLLHTAEAVHRVHTITADGLAAEMTDAGLPAEVGSHSLVVARAPGPVPARTGAGRLRAHSMLADLGHAGDWRILLAREAAVEYGVLDALPGTPEEVAQRADLGPGAVRALLGLLSAAGDVEVDPSGDGNRLRRRAEADPEADPQAEALTVTHARALRRWSQVLGPRLRDRTAEATPHPAPPLRLDPLAAVAQPLVAPVTAACLEMLPAGTRALDLGGGHGAFAHSLAAHGVETVLQDLPAVVERAADAHERAGVTTVAADMHEQLAPGPFGLVLLSTVTNMFSVPVNQALLARVHDVLVPGGAVAVVSYLRGRTAIADAFAVQMLCFSDGGDAHDETAYRAWLTGAGFTDVRVTDLSEPPQSLVSARKSARA